MSAFVAFPVSSAVRPVPQVVPAAAISAGSPKLALSLEKRQPLSSWGWAAATSACAIVGRALGGKRRRRLAAGGQSRTGMRGSGVSSGPDKPAPEIDPRPRESPTTKPSIQMPMINTGSGGKIDVMSKLLEDRIIICSGEIKDDMAQVLMAQMLYLAGEDSSKDITMYINSPGGSVSAGMAIYDTMQMVPCDISTVCFGMAASMGSFLLAAGTKGKRKSLPNARVMIHQPLGGAGGPAADVHIQANEILFLRDILNVHLADMTGQTQDQILKDCDRDNFMTPEEAKAYGLIDSILETKSWPRLQKPPRPRILF